MKIGVVFPQTEFPSDPLAIKDFAQAAEDLGYTHLLAYDHLLGANPDRPGGWSGPYTYTDPFQEPLLLFSYLAGLTQRLSFITGIIILPQRETVLFAKQAATLDVLCQGRLRLGVALGWNKVEYTAQNKDFQNRGARIEEQVQVLRKLWTEELVTFAGRWHSIPDAGLNPLPVQRPIPLWFGGHADPVLQRIARLGDGWLPNYRSAKDAAQALAKLGAYLEPEGRNLSEIGIEPRLRYENGDPSVWRALAEGWALAGATHLTVITMGAGFTTPKEHIHAITRYADALGLQI
ncbi:MAG: LLM class F420-dependent oxidoreductase [Brevefilum sp.]|nr:LLM class F420-dependent oxidoreductase [Brevefilum sp.]